MRVRLNAPPQKYGYTRFAMPDAPQTHAQSFHEHVTIYRLYAMALPPPAVYAHQRATTPAIPQRMRYAYAGS